MLNLKSSLPLLGESQPLHLPALAAYSDLRDSQLNNVTTISQDYFESFK